MVPKFTFVFALAGLAAVFATMTPALAAEPVFNLTPIDDPLVVSDQVHDTNKVKMLRTPDGTIFAVYGLGQDVGQLAFDPQSREPREPYDLVIQSSTDEGATWSAPLNIDNTAAHSSSKGIIEGTGFPPLFPPGDPNEGSVDLASAANAIDYPGDSDKPQAFNAGNNIIITWSSTYCPADETTWPGESQRFSSYFELNGVTIPYSCLYVSRLQWNPGPKQFKDIGPEGEKYITEQITSGVRSAKQDSAQPSPLGVAVLWQEDPLGLQLGDAEGPGEGGSGAKVSGGTDAWYMSLGTPNDPVAEYVTNSWSSPTRVTKNTQNYSRTLQGPERSSHGPGLYDDGSAGLSRANLRLVGQRAIIAWEETKATMGLESGKYVRYLTWPNFTIPPVGVNGCIISKPDENARRVRILTQPLSAGSTGIVFIYKQGDFDQGGPSDIMMRRAVGGYDPSFITPAVDSEHCTSHVNNAGTPGMDNPLVDLTGQTPAVNFSGTLNYGDAPGTAPSAGTSDNPYEDSLAHRGVMSGDTIIIGYSHTPDQVLFNFLANSEPYNFYLVTSKDGGITWLPPKNISGFTAASGVSAREPRVVPTMGNGPGCANPENPTNPADCQNKDIVYFGYGMTTNAGWLQPVYDVDIYMGVTRDGGLNFSPVQAITSGDVMGGHPDLVEDWETQLKVSPDGQRAYVVWSSNPEGPNDAVFRRLELNDRIFADGFEEAP